MEYLLVANSPDHAPALNRRAIEAAAQYPLRHLTPAFTSDEVRELVGA